MRKFLGADFKSGIPTKAVLKFQKNLRMIISLLFTIIVFKFFSCFCTLFIFSYQQRNSISNTLKGLTSLNKTHWIRRLYIFNIIVPSDSFFNLDFQQVFQFLLHLFFKVFQKYYQNYFKIFLILPWMRANRSARFWGESSRKTTI